MIPTNKEWNYHSTIDLYREAVGADATVSPISILRIAPSDGKAILQWRYEAVQSSLAAAWVFRLHYRPRGTDADADSFDLDPMTETFTLKGLQNGIDYELWIDMMDSSNRSVLSHSPVRLVRTGPVPGTVVNYIHPEDLTYGFSGHSTGSPSLTKLSNGTLLASHVVFWGGGGQNLTILFHSKDGGETWSFLTYLFPCFWGKLFVHREKLYMLAVSTEYGALLIGCSLDGGRTWTKPSSLMAGGDREHGGPHKAPMPVIEHNGRLWTAIDYGSWSIGGHASMVISAPSDANLLDPDQWTCTPPLPFCKDWPGIASGGDHPGLLEGNVVPTPEGGIVNLLRYNTKGASPNYGRAIYLNIDQDHPEQPLTFGQVIPFHGNMTKFTVYYDGISKKYWSLVNRVTGANVDQRNILTLVCSFTLTDWEIVKDILDYEHNGWPEDSTKTAFQYVDWIIDGEDILAFSRTSINGAYNFHNANHVIFHRIENFRL